MKKNIFVSTDLLKELKKRKVFEEDSYEDLIWDLLEPNMEFSDETKRNIELSRKEFENGQFISFGELKKELNLK